MFCPYLMTSVTVSFDENGKQLIEDHVADFSFKYQQMALNDWAFNIQCWAVNVGQSSVHVRYAEFYISAREP